MNSTETSKQRETLLAFHRERILPLADRFSEQGTSLFQTSFDPPARSYFIQRSNETPAISAIRLDQLQLEFERLWQNDPDFQAFSSELEQLARQLYVPEEEDGDVSPFIYAMF